VVTRLETPGGENWKIAQYALMLRSVVKKNNHEVKIKTFFISGSWSRASVMTTMNKKQPDAQQS
jgi:hypothetical protein